MLHLERSRLPMMKVPKSAPYIEQRTLASRPLRKDILLLCLISAAWLLIDPRREKNRTATGAYSTYTNFQLMRASAPESKTSSQWVGGGAVVPSLDSSPSRTTKEENPLVSPKPEVVRIPFEEAVLDVKLDGWEDKWFSRAHFDAQRDSPLAEPKIDFVYNWVNGSEDSFREIRHNYELDSPLNDPEGHWISQHSINRYRDWDELRFSLRSLDVYANSFINKIQILVNSVGGDTYRNDGKNMRPQRPVWLKNDEHTNDYIQVLSQESFFAEEAKHCLPTFNSLAIESQIFMTPSITDQLVALSDDMFFGMPHAPSDFYSPLFGTMMGFKADHFNVHDLGGRDQWPTFGEKPFVFYTSYLLNHRFGQRSRHIQAHFGHSISRAVMQEAMASFPQPSAQGACERFRGESNFQIYPWFASFHYSIERFREALLYSFIMSRSDANGDGYLDWTERQDILEAMEPGWRELATHDASMPATQSPNRDRMYYKLPRALQKAGLQAPKVNVNILWTSLDGPETIRNIKCHDFNVDKCFADSFASPRSDSVTSNPDFAASNIFSRLSSQHPSCGDCLIKFLLASTPRGLEPLLPPKSKSHEREVIIKALKKYQHTIVDTDAMKFVMVKDAEQAETELLERTINKGKAFGQWCLNDDVMTESEEQVGQVKDVMRRVFERLWPEKRRWEKNE